MDYTEYVGYLMTAYYNHKANKDFICVDKEADAIPGSGMVHYCIMCIQRAMVYPYVTNRVITCVVCTK